MKSPAEALGMALVAYSHFEQSLRLVYFALALERIHRDTPDPQAASWVPSDPAIERLTAAIDEIETGRLVAAIDDVVRLLPPATNARLSEWRRGDRSLLNRSHDALRLRNSLAHSVFDYTTFSEDPSSLRKFRAGEPVALPAAELLAYTDVFRTLAMDLERFVAGSVLPRRQPE